jgi:ethanolamine utilization protein EutN
MTIGEVIGSVVSTVKNDNFTGQKLMLVKPIDVDGTQFGTSFIALDRVGAGKGDRVLVNHEGGAIKIMYGELMPVQAVIVGIIDRIHLDNSVLEENGD